MSYNKKLKRQYYIENKEKISEREKQRYKNNRERILEQNKKWCKENPEKLRKKHKEWHENNLEKVKEYNKQWHKDNPEYNKQWRKDNPDKVKEQRKKHYRKFYLDIKISRPMEKSLKGNKNGRNWRELVDYTKDDLIKRLKSTIPKGHTWQDFAEGRLQIDHIIPKKVFRFTNPGDKEFKQCWSLYNLRLITKEENILKHERINPILLGLLIKEGELK